MFSILNFSHKVFRHKQLAILSVLIKDQKPFDLKLSLLENRVKKIEITKIWNLTGKAKEFDSKSIPRNIPIYIHISGDGILIRKTKEFAEDESLSDVLPGFDRHNYYYQINPINNGESILSLARKDSVKKWLSELSAYHFRISGLFIGPFPFLTLISNFSDLSEKLIIGYYQINLSEGNVKEVIRREYLEDIPVTLFGEKHSMLDAISLSCGVLAFKKHMSFSFNDQTFTLGFKEATSFLIQKILLKWVLAMLFIMLLMNYFIFENLYTKKDNLQNELVANENMLTNLSRMKEEIELKQSFINDNKLNDFYYLSYFSDQIATVTTDGILLEKLDFNPLLKSIKKEQPILFRSNVLIVHGVAKSIDSYQNFLSDLENKPWHIDLISQQYVYTPGKSTANFQLEIKCDFSSMF